MIRVEVFATTSNGIQWHLQSFCSKSDQVYMLLTFPKLIQAIETASALQLHIDNIDTLPLTQYNMEQSIFLPFDLEFVRLEAYSCGSLGLSGRLNNAG